MWAPGDDPREHCGTVCFPAPPRTGALRGPSQDRGLPFKGNQGATSSRLVPFGLCQLSSGSGAWRGISAARVHSISNSASSSNGPEANSGNDRPADPTQRWPRKRLPERCRGCILRCGRVVGCAVQASRPGGKGKDTDPPFHQHAPPIPGSGSPTRASGKPRLRTPGSGWPRSRPLAPQSHKILGAKRKGPFVTAHRRSDE